MANRPPTALTCFGLLLALAVLAAIPATVCVGQVPSSDPLPLRRVVVPLDRVPAELERVKGGTLVQLPLADFEERVKKAFEAGAALKNPPRLVKARYRADLQKNSLVGRGDWLLVNPGTGAGLLALPSLNLALSNLKTESAEAVLGELDGKALALLVETTGKQTVFFDWTLRGAPGPTGLQFELNLPPAPLASLA